MPESVDAATVRRRWDAACDVAQRQLRATREEARSRGERDYLIRWLTQSIAQLNVIRCGVDGKRYVPGSVASGLFHDVPADIQEPLYADAVVALEEVDRLFHSGLDAMGWDWSEGFPPGWPASLVDRLRAYLPLSKA
jgi:hypothetical protein